MKQTKEGKLKRGMAGLIITILVLGFMMSIATSHNILVVSELAGQGTRGKHKKAYYAAFAGLQFAVSRLRVDPTNTFSANAASRLFFTFKNPADSNEFCKLFFGSAAALTSYTSFSGEIANYSYSSSVPFSTNTDTDSTEYSFILCSYPGTNLNEDYWVKSQGMYNDKATGNISKSQLWGYIKINNTTKTVDLKKFGIMSLQSPAFDTSNAVKDFWDWQDEFF